jgi:hypothetical protein
MLQQRAARAKNWLQKDVAKCTRRWRRFGSVFRLFYA